MKASKLERYLESQCRKAIYQYGMFEKTDSIIIAFSGGKDSLALVQLLSKINGRGVPQVKLYAVHVENVFSPKENRKILQNFCNTYNVELFFAKSNITEKDLNCYACARERRKILFNFAKELNAQKIAFGHHREDNIETLLLNLFQKGEFAGMLPSVYMYRYDITIIRPLYFIKEKDLMSNTSLLQNNFRGKNNCPKEPISHRKKIKNLIRDIENTFPKVRSNLALGSIVYGSKKAAIKPK